ncbi:hypothetical protein [Mycolicibacterium peregrinum]|uniref:hypothetical protein n=1 Tax=Mycolicibacterium peregrinum TaxID=43304 RepID=UPI003AAC51BC
MERIGQLGGTLQALAVLVDRIAMRLEPKFPDLSDLDDQIVAKLPDLSNLPEQTLAAVVALVDSLGLGSLVKFDGIKGLPLIGDQLADHFQDAWDAIFGKGKK